MWRYRWRSLHVRRRYLSMNCRFSPRSLRRRRLLFPSTPHRPSSPHHPHPCVLYSYPQPWPLLRRHSWLSPRKLPPPPSRRYPSGLASSYRSPVSPPSPAPFPAAHPSRSLPSPPPPAFSLPQPWTLPPSPRLIALASLRAPPSPPPPWPSPPSPSRVPPPTPALAPSSPPSSPAFRLPRAIASILARSSAKCSQTRRSRRRSAR